MSPLSRTLVLQEVLMNRLWGSLTSLLLLSVLLGGGCSSNSGVGPEEGPSPGWNEETLEHNGLDR
jgi:hypothetical protein